MWKRDSYSILKTSVYDNSKYIYKKKSKDIIPNPIFGEGINVWNEYRASIYIYINPNPIFFFFWFINESNWKNIYMVRKFMSHRPHRPLV